MDRISGLSDDLLVKILSFLPTKVAVSTSVLSKRWDCLWMWLPKLHYMCRTGSDSEYERLRCFLNRTLPLHRASVIESFHLDCDFPDCKPKDVRLWILIAVFRCVRELHISYHSESCKQEILPSSLYACKSLAVLKLTGDIPLDVPRMVSLPSLKTLQLQRVTGLDGESLRRLLSICFVLKNMFVDISQSENFQKIIVIVPSLQRLTLYLRWGRYVDPLAIDTPSLKYLKLVGIYPTKGSCLVENMPKLEEAHLEVNFTDVKSLIQSITSVKRLTLCSTYLYAKGFVFNQLEHLKLCGCIPCSSNMLARLIKDSPNLRVLDIFQIQTEDHCNDIGMEFWNQPSSVPKFLRSSLQTFSWTEYAGIPEESDVAVYILQNARRLKTAKISSNRTCTQKLGILKELSLSSRASTACQLVFD